MTCSRPGHGCPGERRQLQAPVLPACLCRRPASPLAQRRPSGGGRQVPVAVPECGAVEPARAPRRERCGASRWRGNRASHRLPDLGKRHSKKKPFSGKNKYKSSSSTPGTASRVTHLASGGKRHHRRRTEQSGSGRLAQRLRETPR